MQKSFLFLIIILFTYSIFAQSNISIIEGEAKNNSVKIISIGDSLVNIGKFGRFIYKTEISEPQKILISYEDKEFEVFIEPNEKIEINFDAGDIDNSIVSRGNLSSINKYLFEVAGLYTEYKSYFQIHTPEWISLSKQKSKEILVYSLIFDGKIHLSLYFLNQPKNSITK